VQRYIGASLLSPDEMREVGVFTNAGHSVEIIEKLTERFSRSIKRNERQEKWNFVYLLHH